ncbi:DNase I-like protein [Auricularia subglabra TFB-10046 SS5]|uniref:DNase I-like protein n=1 Tax=Auricularia subglabra (strain TFB-10046 / SS5) TaxID=717982 RepID=J0WQW1_AURST|nr:DNase I-like protein [Auricularia subglabra TFB-10046 SS5]
MASENMKGRSAPRIAGSTKWRKLADDVRRLRIGVMAIQETHLSDAHVDEVHTYYKHLHLINSALPENPTGAGGVGLVFNKLLTNTANLRAHVLVPGRAIVVTMEWHRGDDLSIMAIYAPTNKRENHEMWGTIEQKLREARGRIPKPDLMLGDFNFVEDAIDRFPAKITDMDSPDSFDNLKRYLGLYNGWRDTNPERVDWSWRNRSRSALSRIDRIYCTRALLLASRDWSIDISGMNQDDHSRVSINLADLAMPEVGPGRWSLKAATLQDEGLLSDFDEMGQEALRKVEQMTEGARTNESNLQIVWRDFKRALAARAKRRQREMDCTKISKAETLKNEREQAVAHLRMVGEDSDSNEQARTRLREAEDALHKHLDANHTRTLALKRLSAKKP